MRRALPLAVLALALALPRGAEAGRLPPIQSPLEAVQQLSLPAPAQQLEALKNLKEACSGPRRLALRDQAPVLAKLEALSRGGSAEVKRAALDAFRCFSPDKLARLVEIQLADAEPTVVSYACEVAARTEDPVMAPLLLSRQAASQAACLADGLAAPEAERCVWLTYAPSAVIGRADAAVRKQAGELAVKALAAPAPKLREVAVETIAATRMKAFLPALTEMVDKEKRGAFAKPNDRGLYDRFHKRVAALKRSKE